MAFKLLLIFAIIKFASSDLIFASPSEGPVTTPVDEVNKITTTGDETEEKKVKLSVYGIDLSGQKTVTFKLKTCDAATIRFFPQGLKKGATGYKIRLNRDDNGKKSTAIKRVCEVNKKDGLDCYVKESAEMKSTCEKYKTFWIKFSESGKVTFGKGCEVGSKTLFSYPDNSSFNLGEITISSAQKADWMFGDDLCEKMTDPSPTPAVDEAVTASSDLIFASPSEGPVTTPVDEVNKITTTGDETEEKKVKLSEYGIDLSGQKTMTFKLKTCDAATIRFFPQGLKKGATGYKIRLNRDDNGKKSTAIKRVCEVNKKDGLDCYAKESAEMKSTCEKYKTFWIKFSESGKVKFGKGCEVGSKTLFSYPDSSSFNLGEITISSAQKADWMFGDDLCEKMTDPSPTPPVDEAVTAPSIATKEEDEKSVRVSTTGVDVSGRVTLTFKLKTCGSVYMQILPQAPTIDKTAYKISLNTVTEDKQASYGVARVCQVNEEGKLDCDYETYVRMDSTCEEYKSFWMRFSPSGKSEFGQGCQVGSGTMFSHTDTSPFTLGDIAISSVHDAHWKFDDDSCPNVDVPTTSNKEEEPTQITTNVDDSRLMISKYGISTSYQTSLKFKLKTCQEAIIRFFPQSMIAYSTGYKFFLNKKDEATGEYFSSGRLCYFLDSKLECYNKTNTVMLSPCQQYRDFWFRISDDMNIEFGTGCEEGSNVLFSHSNTLPFVLGNVAITSRGEADWIFGDDSCADVQSSPVGPNTCAISQIPDLIEVKTIGKTNPIRLGQNGFDASGISCFFFEVTSCQPVRLELYPVEERTASLVHRIALQRTDDSGEIFSTHKKCKILVGGDLDCSKTVPSPMESVCSDFKSFWVRLSSTGTVEFGEGCEPGTATMGTYIDKTPFYIGDIKITSNDEAKWRFGSTVCMEREPSNPTSEGGTSDGTSGRHGESTDNGNDDTSNTDSTTSTGTETSNSAGNSPDGQSKTPDTEAEEEGSLSPGGADTAVKNKGGGMESAVSTENEGSSGKSTTTDRDSSMVDDSVDDKGSSSTVTGQTDGSGTGTEGTGTGTGAEGTGTRTEGNETGAEGIGTGAENTGTGTGAEGDGAKLEGEKEDEKISLSSVLNEFLDNSCPSFRLSYLSSMFVILLHGLWSVL